MHAYSNVTVRIFIEQFSHIMTRKAHGTAVHLFLPFIRCQGLKGPSANQCQFIVEQSITTSEESHTRNPTGLNGRTYAKIAREGNLV